MDVRAKQRLCFGVVRLTQTGLVAVSPHVNIAGLTFFLKRMGVGNASPRRLFAFRRRLNQNNKILRRKDK